MNTQFHLFRWIGAILIFVAFSGLAVACGDDDFGPPDRTREDCKKECENFAFFDCVSSSNVADCVDSCNTVSLSEAEAFATCASGGICKGVDCLERFDITVEPNPDAVNSSIDGI